MLRTAAPLIGALGAREIPVHNLIALDQFVRANPKRRAVAFLLAAWLSIILTYAIYVAYRDGLDPYAPIFLALLALGVPSALGLGTYAFSLCCPAAKRRFAVVAGILVLASAAVTVVENHNKKLQREERAQTHENRKRAKHDQDQSDLAKHGESCRNLCNEGINVAQDCVSHCAISRSDAERRIKWREENASCDAQCAADPEPMCDAVCFMDKELAP